MEFKEKLAETFAFKNPTEEIFSGRLKELEKFELYTLQPGAQIVVYGARSIGKTSFVKHAIKKSRKKAINIQCQKNDTFESIFQRIFKSLEIPKSESQSNASSISGGLFGSSASASTSSDKTSFPEQINPAGVAQLFTQKSYNDIAFLFFDEFDLIEDKKTKEDFAMLMKFFSDNVPHTKLIITGVAKDVIDLIDMHESNRRCLSAIFLDIMDNDALKEIITKGEQVLDVTFYPEVKDKIVALSEGFPFYTHLFAFGCLFHKKEKQSLVKNEDFEKALEFAYENANNGMKYRYESLIKTSGNPETIECILWSCAQDYLISEFSVQSIIKNYQIITGMELSPQSLNNYLGRLKKEKILDQISKRVGYYHFIDPLFKIYINICRKQKPTQTQFIPT